MYGGAWLTDVLSVGSSTVMAKKKPALPESRRTPNRTSKATPPEGVGSRTAILARTAEDLFVELFGRLHVEARSAATRDARLRVTMIADTLSALLDVYQSGQPSDLGEAHGWARRHLAKRNRLVWFGASPHDLVEAQACVLAAVHRATAPNSDDGGGGDPDAKLPPAIAVLAGVEDMRAAPIMPPLPQDVDVVEVIDGILKRRTEQGLLDPPGIAREVLVAFGASRPEVDKLFKNPVVEERAAEMLKTNVTSRG